MPKTRMRLSKDAVLEEVKTLRKKIINICDASPSKLKRLYNAAFPGSVQAATPTENEMRHSLLMQATYYMTNVLNLE